MTATGETTPAELLGHLNAVERVNAPPRLYISGDPRLATDWPRVAVIGTRKPTPEGLRRTTRLARELVANDVTVVSGLALGVDGQAHRAAIEAGGRTIAVLGTPLDKVTPVGHRDLQHEIMRRHLAVSQFAPGSTIHRSNFVRRNRVMALLSNASVIIEAGATSGTQSQGWEALRLGRALFLAKSLVDTDLAWPAKMLEYGAQVLTDTSDVLDTLPWGPLSDIAL